MTLADRPARMAGRRDPIMISAPTHSQRSRSYGRAVAAFSAVLLPVAAAPTRAQDVMQVGADTHTVLLENSRVRVLAAHVPPGGKVPMHSHPANVIYFFGDATLRITLPDGSSRTVSIKAATAVSNGPLTHAIENIGTTEFSEIQVELKDATAAL